MKTRIYFLDNLRTFLIFLVILLHAGLVYELVLEKNWIVIDPVNNNSIGLIRMYLDLFVMFALFFISGYFIPHSAKNNTSLNFLKSKFKRILLPWIVAVFTLIPAYKAIFLFSRGLPQEPWFTYFHIFQRTGGDMLFFADNPTQNWLWFLPILFLFQLVYLALSKTKLLSLNISLKTAVILTFVIGVAYSMIISNLNLRGWYHSPIIHFQRERLLLYFIVFLLGSLCNKLKVFDSKTMNRKYYIISNIVLTPSLGIFTVVAINLFFNMVDPGRNYYFISPIVDRLVYYIAMIASMFSFLQILLYIFRYKLNKTNRILGELSKNSYFVYVIHMIVIGVIALWMINLPIPAIIKFIILAILTFIVSNIIVYGYRRLFQKFLSKRVVTIPALIAALLLTIIIYGQQENLSGENIELTTIEEVSVAPSIGLHEAVLTGNITAIQQHINAGSDLDEKDEYGGSSSLMIAATFGQIEAAKLLIKSGADVNQINHEGSTPLHSAAFFCRTEIVKALLENGADKNIRNGAGSTALESVAIPFDYVQSIYDQLGVALGPLGLKLDYDMIKTTRPKIAQLLQ